MRNLLYEIGSGLAFLFIITFCCLLFVACANDIQGEGNTINNESNINPTFRNEQHNSTNKLGITASLARDYSTTPKGAVGYYFSNNGEK